jgi:hypothetical protein
MLPVSAGTRDERRNAERALAITAVLGLFQPASMSLGSWWNWQARAQERVQENGREVNASKILLCLHFWL